MIPFRSFVRFVLSIRKDNGCPSDLNHMAKKTKNKNKTTKNKQNKTKQKRKANSNIPISAQNEEKSAKFARLMSKQNQM